MNTYNKLLLDEAQTMISLLNKYLDNANLNVEKKVSKNIKFGISISINFIRNMMIIIKSR